MCGPCKLARRLVSLNQPFTRCRSHSVFTAVRALLSRGRTYEKAVETFEPYKLVQEPDETARDVMRQIAERSIRQRQPAFLFVNNRLEGDAPSTIEGVVERI